MKMAYVTWNKDSVADDKILDDLKEFSNGELVLDDNINLAKVDLKAPAGGARKGGSHQNQHKSRGAGNRSQGNNGGAKKRANTKRY